MPPAARRLLTLSAFLLSAVASGCSKHSQPTAPQAQESRLAAPAPGVNANNGQDAGVYPLTVGNSWRLKGSTIWRVHRTGSPPQVFNQSSFTITLDLSCEDTSSTFIERLREEFPGGGMLTVWRRYRQTSEGLWVSRPQSYPSPCGEFVPQSVLGGQGRLGARPAGLPRVARDEALGSGVAASLLRLERKRAALDLLAADPSAPDIRLLAFPLRPGQSWVQQNLAGLPVVMTVEAHETLKTPVGAIPAWRIRIDNPFFSPGRDYSRVWFGRAGYVQFHLHLDDDIEENGVVVGTTTTDETHQIEAIQLAEPGRFSVARQ
jgi:hypothetical protein